MRIDVRDPELQKAVNWLQEHGHSEVDGLHDWLLVSQLQLGGEPWAEVLASEDSPLAVIEVADPAAEMRALLALRNRYWSAQ